MIVLRISILSRQWSKPACLSHRIPFRSTLENMPSRTVKSSLDPGFLACLPSTGRAFTQKSMVVLTTLTLRTMDLWHHHTWFMDNNDRLHLGRKTHFTMSSYSIPVSYFLFIKAIYAIEDICPFNLVGSCDECDDSCQIHPSGTNAQVYSVVARQPIACMEATVNHSLFQAAAQDSRMTRGGWATSSSS